MGMAEDILREEEDIALGDRIETLLGFKLEVSAESIITEEASGELTGVSAWASEE